ncbi:hypothetical protein H8356DRAFT_1323717 [Neocallimastix lanati (nom. inval.)]|nr:hypothetical protein H8356DRAFT_1323717 [Neocallimastix sp. JGI-2020a]
MQIATTILINIQLYRKFWKYENDMKIPFEYEVNSRNFESNSRKAIFTIYNENSKGYKNFIEDKMKVYFKRVVKFLEDQPANLIENGEIEEENIEEKTTTTGMIQLKISKKTKQGEKERDSNMQDILKNSSNDPKRKIKNKKKKEINKTEKITILKNNINITNEKDKSIKNKDEIILNRNVNKDIYLNKYSKTNLRKKYYVTDIERYLEDMLEKFESKDYDDEELFDPITHRSAVKSLNTSDYLYKNRFNTTLLGTKDKKLEKYLDYTNDKETRRSITGIYLFYGFRSNQLILKASKMSLWYRNVMGEIKSKGECAKLYIVNQKAIYNDENNTINQNQNI